MSVGGAMAIDTLDACILKACAHMASGAGYCLVATNQWELREVVIKANVCPPGSLTVTLCALGSFLAFMGVVLAVAGGAPGV